MFLNEIAYILRNPYKARVASPFAFAWNSADVYFNPWRDHVHGIPFGTLKLKEKKALLQSHFTVPDGWEHVNGRILNRFFVAYDLVEKRVTDSIRFFHCSYCLWATGKYYLYGRRNAGKDPGYLPARIPRG